MRHSISDTAEWGDYVAGPRIVTAETKKAMRKLLDEIQDGAFAKKFIEENETGRHEFARIRKEEAAHGIEKVGAELRKAMPFLDPVRSRTAPSSRPSSQHQSTPRAQVPGCFHFLNRSAGASPKLSTNNMCKHTCSRFGRWINRLCGGSTWRVPAYIVRNSCSFFSRACHFA